MIIIQSLEVTKLTRKLNVFTRKMCFGTSWQVNYEMSELSEFSVRCFRLILHSKRKNSLFRTRLQFTCEMFISKVFRGPCGKKYLPLYLTQIVHSNSKMLFL